MSIQADSAASELHVDPDRAVLPVRMGNVVFHGGFARAIREAQAVLHAAGAGQLEVVRRANEPGEPFVEIDGQVFIARSTLDISLINPARFEIRIAQAERCKYVAGGLGLGIAQNENSPFEVGATTPVDAVLEYLARQISDTKLGRDILAAAEADTSAADAAVADRIARLVEKCLRRELSPGGMLHRR